MTKKISNDTSIYIKNTLLNILHNTRITWNIIEQVSTLEATVVQFLMGESADCSIVGTGMEITEPLAIPATGGIARWDYFSVFGVWAPAGSHRLKLCVNGGVGTNVDRITFVLVSEGVTDRLTGHYPARFFLWDVGSAVSKRLDEFRAIYTYVSNHWPKIAVYLIL